jgi:hypothetical protein
VLPACLAALRAQTESADESLVLVQRPECSWLIARLLVENRASSFRSARCARSGIGPMPATSPLIPQPVWELCNFLKVPSALSLGSR